nr:14672_t:CDS:2 [Entrophospora candida]
MPNDTIKFKPYVVNNKSALINKSTVFIIENKYQRGLGVNSSDCIRRRYLGISSTSVSNERLLSDVNNYITPKRNE